MQKLLIEKLTRIDKVQCGIIILLLKGSKILYFVFLLNFKKNIYKIRPLLEVKDYHFHQQFQKFVYFIKYETCSAARATMDYILG